MLGLEFGNVTNVLKNITTLVVTCLLLTTFVADVEAQRLNRGRVSGGQGGRIADSTVDYNDIDEANFHIQTSGDCGAETCTGSGEICWETATNQISVCESGAFVALSTEVPDCIAGTGHLNYNQSTSTWSCNAYVFEGATVDGFETSLAVTDPTADRTITFPNATGGVVLDSGTGTAACSNGEILKQSAGVWACGADVNTGVTSIANDLWVSTGGNDTGTDCSVGQPCATIQNAIIQAYTNGPPSSTNPYRINVAPGTYTENDIQFTTDGTSAGQPVDWVSIQGSGEKATIILSGDTTKPVFDFTGAGNCSLYDLAVKGKLEQATANIYFGPGWHNTRLWSVGSSVTTQSTAWSALEIDGIGATLWIRDFTPFNLAANEQAPAVKLRLGGAGTGEAGFCTDGDKFGACLVDADCGASGTCTHGAADFLMERSFIQSDAMGAHVEGLRACANGLTTLTGSIDPTASTAVVGVGTSFTTEVVVGEMITVNSETRTVESITDNTNLVVTVAFTNTANDTTPQVSNDGWGCDVDGDCDTGGSCFEGICSDDTTISCTEAGEATQCGGGTPDCLVGQSFNNIWLDNRWQVSGAEGGICSDDTDTFCRTETDCLTTCTVDSDCNGVIPTATCVESGATDYCSCESFGLWLDGDNHTMTMSQEDFVCNRKTSTCTEPTAYLATVGGATVLECGLDILGENKTVEYTADGNASTITHDCVAGAKILNLEPLTSDPTTASDDTGALWFNTAEGRIKHYDGTANRTMLDTGTTVTVAQGGTGETSYTTGDILIAAASTNLNPLSGTVNRYLKYAGTAPLWTTIDLSDTTGSFANALDETLGGFGESLDGTSATSNCAYIRPSGGTPLCSALSTDVLVGRAGSGSVGEIAVGTNEVVARVGASSLGGLSIAGQQVLGRISAGGNIASISLENDLWNTATGKELTVANGGTGLQTVPADAVLIGAGTADMATAVIPDCDTGAKYLQYDQAGNSFTCVPSPVTVFVSTCPGTSASANCNITDAKRYGKVDCSEHGYRPENRNLGAFGFSTAATAASKSEFECTVTRMTCSASVAMDTSPDGPVDCGFRNITDASESVFCTIAAGATTCTGTGSEFVGLGDDIAPFIDCDNTNSACPSANGQYSISAYCTE